MKHCHVIIFDISVILIGLTQRVDFICLVKPNILPLCILKVFVGENNTVGLVRFFGDGIESSDFSVFEKFQVKVLILFCKSD